MSCILLLEPQTLVDEESLNEIYNNTSGENSHDTETIVGDELYVFPAVLVVAFGSKRNVVGTTGYNFSNLHYLQSTIVSVLNNEKVWNT